MLGLGSRVTRAALAGFAVNKRGDRISVVTGYSVTEFKNLDRKSGD